MKRLLASLLALLLVLTSVLFMVSCDENPEVPDDPTLDNPTPDSPEDETPPVPTVESAMAQLSSWLSKSEGGRLELVLYTEMVSVSQGVETVTRQEYPVEVLFTQEPTLTGELAPHMWQITLSAPEEGGWYRAYYVNDNLYFESYEENVTYFLSELDKEVILPLYQELLLVVHEMVKALPEADLDYEVVEGEDGSYSLLSITDTTSQAESARAFVVDLADMTVSEAVARYLLGDPEADLSSQPAAVVDFLATTSLESLYQTIESLIAPMTLAEAVEAIKAEYPEEEELLLTLDTLLAMRETQGERTLLSLLAENMGIPEEGQTEEVMDAFQKTVESIVSEMLVHKIGEIPVLSQYMGDEEGNLSIVPITYAELVEPLKLFEMKESKETEEIFLDKDGCPTSGKSEYTLFAGSEMEMMPGHVVSMEMGIRIGVEWTLSPYEGEIVLPEGDDVHYVETELF